MANTMREILEAREARWLRRLELSRRGTVLTVTLNVPGPDKTAPHWVNAHRRLCAILECGLRPFGLRYRERNVAADGAEAHFVLGTDALKAKEIAVRFEEEHPAGRLVDADVMDASGRPVGRDVLGLPPRRCLCCGRPARDCAALRAHPLEEVLARAEAILDAVWERSGAGGGERRDG